MPQLEGIRIQNYRALKKVRMGRTIDTRDHEPLPKMAALVGPNGSGKSSFLDALGFLGDCLTSSVEEACDREHRGGFERMRTSGAGGAMVFDLYYRESALERPISYELHIDLDGQRRPSVAYERLRQRNENQTWGAPLSYLELTRGKGFAWTGEKDKKTNKNTKEPVKLDDARKLGIVSLGNLSQHPNIVRFRRFLEGWYLSYFEPSKARALPMAGAQKHLNRTGENLANYLQFMERQIGNAEFNKLLGRVAKGIPGIEKIHSKPSDDKRLLIQFNERGYKDVFYQADMSDGTLKFLAYLLLLEDPEPSPLIGIEEPENGLHHKLLGPLAQTMRTYAQGAGPQVFVTTHSPYFVDALTPPEVWTIDKGVDGFSEIRCAADDEVVRAMFAEGLPLGGLWFSGHFGHGNPA
ncbi:MAG: AAA family ATPase [Verrucomicrobiota bacterium]|jgi:predicted ATPase